MDISPSLMIEVMDEEFSIEDSLGILLENLQICKSKLVKLCDEAEKKKNVGRNISPETREKDEINFINNLCLSIEHDLPVDLPIPYTEDMDENLKDFLELEIKAAEHLDRVIAADVKETKQEVQELNNKTEKFVTMKEALSDRGLSYDIRNYKEILNRVAKKFKETKEDLAKIVNMIFPDNGDFQDLLADLTKAYIRGGDDVYVEVILEHKSLIRFLLECDLIVFHPYNKNLIKLTELI